ncbi:hypothetical protein ACMZ6Z_09200, partial [Streptococcus pluranimalium]
VPFRQMWCLSEPNINGFFLSSLILQIGFCKWLTSHIVIKKSKTKRVYGINFSDAAYACLKFLRGTLTSSQLRTYIAKYLSIIRVNRTFPRKIKSQAPVSFTYRVP